MPPIKTELLGDGGVYRQRKKALMERALGAELTHHLGYEKGAALPAVPGATAAMAAPAKPF
jgi:putative transposase